MGLLGFFRKNPQPVSDDSQFAADLQAEPISADRMRLLWHDPRTLDLLASAVGRSDTLIVDAGAASQPKWVLEDFAWAKQVNVSAVEAAEASKRQDYSTAIACYRRALLLAPGCDLYLMSIGACYGSLGQIRKGLRYLERAHKINPSNERIKRNLDMARRAEMQMR